jgi:hypothetical protein
MAGEGPRKRRKKARRRPKGAKRQLAARRRRQQVAMRLAAAVTVLVGALLVWVAVDLSTGDEGTRMDAFESVPAGARADLLYLSYLDSLARDDRALPALVDDEALLAPQLVARAGVDRRRAEAWGLVPADEPDQGPLNELFRELNRRGRVILPLYGEALWTHLRERKLHSGYLVFGQTAAAGASETDLCAVITAANSIQPEYSALIYRDPATGQLVHGAFGDMPQFAYIGGARLGDDIPAVYREYFQMRDARDRKPLY